MNSYPKICAIGQKYIADIFENEVEVTEKVDGSQFVFGKIDGELKIRSKGAEIIPEVAPKMFKKGVDYVVSIQEKIPDNTSFYCEYLEKPKHNVLQYDNTPKNHLVLFAVCEGQDFVKKQKEYAELFDIDSIPVLFEGKINSLDELEKLLETQSYLGGKKIEGVVVKDYKKEYMIGGQIIPIMSGKYVSEEFKEVHNKNWSKDHKTKDRVSVYLSGFKTEARWVKAIQHLKENNEIEDSPKDIGKLMKEINQDISQEEKENIKDWLWNEHKGHLSKVVTAGFPEWYKKRLMASSFETVDNFPKSK
jgi:hypothetical protein